MWREDGQLNKQTNIFHYPFLAVFLLKILEIVLRIYLKGTILGKYTVNYSMVRSGLNTVRQPKSRQLTVFQYDLLNEPQAESRQVV